MMVALAMALTALKAQNTVKRETFVYAVKDSVTLRLDKYVDEQVTHSGKRPVFIYVHGGGFAMGSRINALQIIYGKHFVSRGFVAISIDYRLELANKKQPDEAASLSAVKTGYSDLIDATAFVISKAKEWDIDTGMIIISGGSAGAIACLSAEYDICNEGPHAQRLPKGFNYAGIISHAGCVLVRQDSLKWKNKPCPMLLMHGNVDQLVPFDKRAVLGDLYAGSSYIHRQLVQMNVSHWLYEESGADHIVALKPLQYNFAETDAFIDKFVMKKQHSIVHTIWKDEKPDSMKDLYNVVPLYITGWDRTDEEIKEK